MSTVSLVIMTCNAEQFIARQLEQLLTQTRRPDEILVIDSSSDDHTAEIVRSYGRIHARIQLIVIDRKDFDHGGSRNMACRRAMGEFVLFMTQDALPLDQCYIERLLEPLSDPDTAAVCGRQVAYPNAAAYEKLTREFNYPPQSKTWSKADISQLGVKTYFFSDVCSAYRRTAFEAVGGFDQPIETNEDMMIAAKLIHDGYTLAYASDAVVFHSHDYSLKQEYARSFLTGKVMRKYRDRLVGTNSNAEGKRLLRYVLARLLEEKKNFACIQFCFSAAIRLLGNHAGKLRQIGTLANK